jgi:hypothetical protein
MNSLNLEGLENGNGRPVPETTCGTGKGADAVSLVPFDSYPKGCRETLGLVRGSNAKHGYGLKLMRLTGQRCCAYCGTDLTATYEAWLTLVVDHVVPVAVCKSSQIREEWCWDYSNMVLACAACNGFCNRYRPLFPLAPVDTLAAFYDLRDKIFEERRKVIAARHKEERSFFNEISASNPPA